MVHWRAVAGFVLLALSLSGCGDSPGADDVPSGLAVEEVSASGSLGAITGVVVSETITPMAGVNVSAEGLGSAVQTNDLGQFSFVDVRPGSYIVTAEKPSFLPRQTVVAVEAGAAATVRLVLPIDNRTDPRHLTVSYQGHVTASAGQGSTLTDLAMEAAGMGSSCQCSFPVVVEGAWDRIVVEATWEDTVSSPAGPTEFRAQLEFGTEFVIASDASPMNVVFESKDFQVGQEGRLFVGPESPWLYVEQGFQVFVTVWYDSLPPENWSFINGDP